MLHQSHLFFLSLDMFPSVYGLTVKLNSPTKCFTMPEVFIFSPESIAIGQAFSWVSIELYTSLLLRLMSL